MSSRSGAIRAGYFVLGAAYNLRLIILKTGSEVLSMEMGVWDFLLMLLVAGIIGAIGQAVAGYSTPGCAMSIVIGFVGAFVGSMIQKLTKFPEFITVSVGDTRFPIVWAVIGSAICVLILRLILGRRATAD